LRTLLDFWIVLGRLLVAGMLPNNVGVVVLIIVLVLALK
jgi:hypothetical protein